MSDELYFCLHLTENEHGVVMGELEDLCKNHDLDLLYYRELKEGHIPMYREIKLKGNIGYVRGYIKKSKLEEHIEHNPHRIKA
jgi:hypothetical protein